MTAKQTSLYWRTWGALCTEFDWRNADTARRHALHAEAGCPESSKDWDNKSMDRFLAHVRALLQGKRTGGPKIVDEAGARRRLEWRIKKDLRDAGLSLDYVAKVSTDMYGLGCWSLLSLDQLENLRDTIHNRTRGARRSKKSVSVRAPSPIRTTRAKPMQPAGIDCPF